MPCRKRLQSAAATWSGRSALNWVAEDSPLAVILNGCEALHRALASWNSLPSFPTAALCDQARQELRPLLHPRNLNNDELDPLLLEKLRELDFAVDVPANLTLALLHDAITLLRRNVQPMQGRLGRGLRYSAEARQYARTLKAEHPQLSAKDIRALTKGRFPQAKLPPGPGIKKFRDWMNSSRKDD